MLVQEMLPLEVANRCHFLVMCEDAVAHDRAMEVCSGIIARFDVELAFVFSFWKFKDLNDSVSAHSAAQAVARADIILFSLSDPVLTPAATNWLDFCVKTRTKTEGALAVMVANVQGLGLAVEALVLRLQYAANQLRMDFLPLLPEITGTNIETTADSAVALRKQSMEEPGFNHWGLNEYS